MNKRIKKKLLKADTQKQISPYRLKLLYKQAIYFFEKLPDISMLAKTIEVALDIINKAFNEVLKNIPDVLKNIQKESRFLND